MIVPISAVDITLTPGEWVVPADLRARAPKHWAAQVARNPHLWDGRILGVLAAEQKGGVRVEGGVLKADAREDAYSVFLTWRDEGLQDIAMHNLFGSALVVSSDGALIFGVMGEDTANAGRIYPPGGSLEPRDVRDGKVDVLGCIALELAEETGLPIAEAEEGGLLAVFDGPRISIGQILRFPETADTLLARIRADLEVQEHRELADVVALYRSSEVAALGELVPPYALTVARHLLPE